MKKNKMYEDIGFAKIDHHRHQRKGFPEVIYCEGKTPDQIVGIARRIWDHGHNVLATRADRKAFRAVKKILRQAKYYETARIIAVKKKAESGTQKAEHRIAIVTAGTADLPVAEEAAVTAEFLGESVDRIYDVGVAGIHRLMKNLDRIKKAPVVIVVAGMEGALASVVGGLIDKPIIAVPTSVGYGASFKGLAALLTMLNSCAPGVAVVNIDNGFGAGSLASIINRNR
ncbi:MAG: nickel pincer cofactor biosynthesis protein LarB [Candidatus Margulisbacteria bacterium]|nr:nickel pincer cofactor biosynthesis protein LarB [Candidatus Margulisiibacteriota bacterium]